MPEDTPGRADQEFHEARVLAYRELRRIVVEEAGRVAQDWDSLSPESQQGIERAFRAMFRVASQGRREAERDLYAARREVFYADYGPEFGSLAREYVQSVSPNAYEIGLTGDLPRSPVVVAPLFGQALVEEQAKVPEADRRAWAATLFTRMEEFRT